jgi:MFS family permease
LTTRPAGVFYGWVVVGAGFAILFLAYGVQYAFGLFFNALTAEFGWSRASLSGVFSVYAGTYSFFGLVAGRLTDRWGPRRVVLLGGLCLGGGLAAAGTVTSLAPLYGAYVVAALGMSTAYVPCTATVVRWFTARRGLAVGLVVSGAGVGIFACPPLVEVLIARLGWRAAYGLVGAGLALGLAALSRLLVREPAALGVVPHGGAAEATADGLQAGTADGWPLGRVVRHRTFLALAGVYTATWMPVFLPTVHLAPLARDLGLPAAVAAATLSVLGVGSLAGRLVMSALSDRIGRRAALAVSLALQAASFGGLAVAAAAPGLLAAAAVYGFAYGAVTALLPPIAADFFGAAHAGSIVGLVFGVAGPTAALGPVAGGLVHDATGSYGWAFGGAAALNVAALALLGLARAPGRAVSSLPSPR